MCDPVTATMLIMGGSMVYNDVARKKADKEAGKAQAKQEKDEFKAKKIMEKEKEASMASAAEDQRKQQARESAFRAGGYHSTFGTSGGGLGLTSPPKTGMNKLLGG